MPNRDDEPEKVPNPEEDRVNLEHNLLEHPRSNLPALTTKFRRRLNSRHHANNNPQGDHQYTFVQ